MPELFISTERQLVIDGCKTIKIIAIGSNTREMQDKVLRILGTSHPYYAWKTDRWSPGWQGTPCDLFYGLALEDYMKVREYLFGKTTLQVGQHLFTRDGRIRSNAVVDSELTDDRYTVMTDFGNMLIMSAVDIYSQWYIQREGEDPQISDLDSWYQDRDRLVYPAEIYAQRAQQAFDAEHKQ